jgi:hypothetical protein
MLIYAGCVGHVFNILALIMFCSTEHVHIRSGTVVPSNGEA